VAQAGFQFTILLPPWCWVLQLYSFMPGYNDYFLALSPCLRVGSGRKAPRMAEKFGYFQLVTSISTPRPNTLEVAISQ
jgi:hypothetical protein